MELVKLPIHDSTKKLLKEMGIVFMKDDDTFITRGYNEKLKKWGNYEIALYSEIEFDLKDDEMPNFYFKITFNNDEVALLQATPQLLAVIQLFTMDRVSNGAMAEHILELGEEQGYGQEDF